MDNYEAENRELLDRFAAAIRNNDNSDWFDEDELLDIFDFAGDYGMDYLRAEALFWGARTFPDSKALIERRAVFYADVLGRDAVNNFSDDHAEVDSKLSRILTARANINDSKEALKFIEHIIDENLSLDDEEIIQLVNFAAETNNLKWLDQNTDKVLAVLSYKPAFLYEFAAASIQHGEYKMALKLLDELVTELPYNAEYWSLISACHLQLDDIDAAADAAEMALAIEPDNAEALVSKARCMARINPDELLNMVIEHPLVMSIIEIAIDRFRNEMGRDKRIGDAIFSAIKDRLHEWASSVAIQSAAIIIMPDKMDAHLDELWQMESDNAENLSAKIAVWTQWAQSLYISNFVTAANVIVSAIYRNVPDDAVGVTAADITPILSLGLVIHYTVGDYNSACDDAEMLLRICSDLSPVGHAIYVTSLIKLAKYGSARNYIYRFMHKYESGQYHQSLDNIVAQGVLDRLSYSVGLQWLCNFFVDTLSKIEPDKIVSFDVDSFTPFNLSQL